MRRLPTVALRRALPLLLAAGVAAAATPPPVATAAAAPTAPPTPRIPAHVLGLGEPRKPEPFTIGQRLLDAVRRADRPTIERALAHGAPIGARDDIGRGVVLLAVLDAHDLDLARWLHGRGAVVDEADNGGRTPLSFAAADGRVDIVTWLLEQGAAADRRDAQQRTPLFHAALGDHPEVIAVLVARGADVNARDQWQDTPLIAACAKGNAGAAAFLLQHGADPALKDQEGRTARQRAAPGTSPCQ
ncbi:MAG TPA: ankyrin repeat domain-containing protein [Candidatus Dormibacteraeota bacterium]|nr:ankyrin repeat domain-containing protein [Candidatus Dormibacteraeota bacterium]